MRRDGRAINHLDLFVNSSNPRNFPFFLFFPLVTAYIYIHSQDYYYAFPIFRPSFISHTTFICNSSCPAFPLPPLLLSTIQRYSAPQSPISVIIFRPFERSRTASISARSASESRNLNTLRLSSGCSETPRRVPFFRVNRQKKSAKPKMAPTKLLPDN